MIGEVVLCVGIVMSSYLATERARGARMLTRTARWPTTDRAEIGRLTHSYIWTATAYALASAAMVAAIVVRHA